MFSTYINTYNFKLLFAKAKTEYISFPSGSNLIRAILKPCLTLICEETGRHDFLEYKKQNEKRDTN